MTDRSENMAAGARLTDALIAHDLGAARSAYAPDALIWHSNTQKAVGRDEDVKALEALLTMVPDVRFEDVTRLATDTGCVQTYVVRGATAAGPFAMPICEIIEVSQGRIARMYAYFDPSPLVAAATRPTSHP